MRKILLPGSSKAKSPTQQPDPAQETIPEDSDSTNLVSVLGPGFRGQAGSFPAKLTPDKVLSLQRFMGNQAVLRMLHRAKESLPQPPLSSPVNGTAQAAPTQPPIIQRLWKKNKKWISIKEFEYFDEGGFDQYIDMDDDPPKLLVINNQKTYGMIFILLQTEDGKEWVYNGDSQGKALETLLMEIDKGNSKEENDVSDEEEEPKETIGEEKISSSFLSPKSQISLSSRFNLSKTQNKTGSSSKGEIEIKKERKSFILPGEEKKSLSPSRREKTSDTPLTFKKQTTQSKRSTKLKSSIISSSSDEEEVKVGELSQGFFTHIFKGEIVGSSHIGLHSRRDILKKSLKVSFFRRSRPDENGVYVAEVRIEGNNVSKCSMFFPDDWSQEKIKIGVKEAFLNPRRKPIPTLSFYGFSKTCGICIGGLSDKGSKLKFLTDIDTAYPMYKGNMFNPDALPGLIDEDPDPLMGVNGEIEEASEKESILSPIGKSNRNSNQPIKEKGGILTTSSLSIRPNLKGNQSLSLNSGPLIKSSPRKEETRDKGLFISSPGKRESSLSFSQSGNRGKNTPLSIKKEEKEFLSNPSPIITQNTTTSSFSLEPKEGMELNPTSKSLLQPRSNRNTTISLPQPKNNTTSSPQLESMEKKKGIQPLIVPPPISTLPFSSSMPFSTFNKPSFSYDSSDLFSGEEDENLTVKSEPKKEKKEKKKKKEKEKKGKEIVQEETGTWQKTSNAMEGGAEHLDDTDNYIQYLETGGEKERLLIILKDRSWGTLYTRDSSDDQWEELEDIDEETGLITLLNKIDKDTGNSDGEDDDLETESISSQRSSKPVPKERDLREEAKKRKIEGAEVSTYIKIRQKGFEKEEIADAGHHGQGADFIVQTSSEVWIVEAKGTTVTWTSKDDVTFASGAHVPPKQIAWGIQKAQNNIIKILERPISKRINTESLLLAVMNLSVPGSMMAIITCQDDFKKVVVEQHPVNVVEVITFINECGQEKLEYLVKMLFEKLGDEQSLEDMFPPKKLEQIGKLYAKHAVKEAKNQIFKIIENDIIMDWEDLVTANKLDLAVYDYLETAYNLARLDNDHEILKGSQQSANPLSTKKLSKIKEEHDRKKNIKGKYYIHLQPVLGKLPDKEKL